MKATVLSIIGIFFLSLVSVDAQEIDAERSVVSFEIGNMKIRTVDGSFSGFSGTVNFNPDDLANSTFSVCIDPSTVNTNNKKRDDHLRNEDFFHVEKYPSICFESVSISKSGDNFLTKGKLTILETTKMVEIPFSFSSGAFIGNLEIMRLDYGVGVGTGEGMVSNPVKMKIVCQLK